MMETTKQEKKITVNAAGEGSKGYFIRVKTGDETLNWKIQRLLEKWYFKISHPLLKNSLINS